MASAQSGSLGLEAFGKGWWLFAYLASTLLVESQAQGAGGEWVTDHPEFPSRFGCPHGYVDRTQGKAKYWACARGCPGGPFADAEDCGCACVLPEELNKPSFRGKATSTTTLRGIASNVAQQSGSQQTTMPPSSSRQTTPANTQRSTTRSEEPAFRSVWTTLPPGSTNLRIAPKAASEEADAPGGLPGIAIFVIVICSVVVLGTCMLMLVVHYIGEKDPAKRTRQVMWPPTINKTNMACAPVTDHVVLDPRGPRRAWDGSTLALDCAVKAIEKMSPCPSDASTRQPSPTPSEGSAPLSTASSTTGILTVSTSTPPRGTHHSNPYAAQAVDFVTWQQIAYQQQQHVQRERLHAAGSQSTAASHEIYSPQCMVHLPAEQGQFAAVAEQQPVQRISKHSHLKSTRAQPIRQQRSRQGRDARSAQHSQLRNSQRVDLHSRHVSPPSVQDIYLSQPGQPPAGAHSSNGHDSGEAQNGKRCTSRERHSHREDAVSWRDAFKGQTMNPAGSNSASRGTPPENDAHTPTTPSWRDALQGKTFPQTGSPSCSEA